MNNKRIYQSVNHVCQLVRRFAIINMEYILRIFQILRLDRCPGSSASIETAVVN
jgi:hypothetical protein